MKTTTPLLALNSSAFAKSPGNFSPIDGVPAISKKSNYNLFNLSPDRPDATNLRSPSMPEASQSKYPSLTSDAMTASNPPLGEPSTSRPDSIITPTSKPFLISTTEPKEAPTASTTAPITNLNSSTPLSSASASTKKPGLPQIPSAPGRKTATKPTSPEA